jgi:hypothetical protein
MSQIKMVQRNSNQEHKTKKNPVISAQQQKQHKATLNIHKSNNKAIIHTKNTMMLAHQNDIISQIFRPVKQHNMISPRISQNVQMNKQRNTNQNQQHNNNLILNTKPVSVPVSVPVPVPKPVPKTKPVPININTLLHKIRTVRNVYQTEYRDVISRGLGDFLRGCFFLLQLGDMHNFECIIDINNHPISKVLKNCSHKYTIENINFFSNNNFKPNVTQDLIIGHDKNPECFDEFVQYLSRQNIQNEIVSVYVTSFPLYDSINNRHKERIKKLLIPNESMQIYLDYTLVSLNLQPYTYSIIHVRLGDDYLIRGKSIVNPFAMRNIRFYLSQLNLNARYLLLCDSNLIKNAICRTNPNIKTTYNPITHLGENVSTLNDTTIKNTMLDFYLMSLSNRIHSFSTYNHGTGFSKWCSEIYTIPYTCKLVKSN